VSGRVVVAFVLAFASASVAFAGSAMQAFEARAIPREQGLRAALLLELLRRPLWVAGTTLNVVAFGGQVVALALASLAIVQPTFALGLVVLVLIAVWKLSERVGIREVGGIVAIIAGLVVLAFVAPRHDHLPQTLAAALVLAAALALIVLLLVALRLTDRRGGLAASLAGGLAYAWLSFAGTLLGEAFTDRDWAAVGGWGAAIVVAAILAVGAEMTALQTWPITRSKPVVFVLQTLVPAFGAAFFSSRRFGPASGIPFAAALIVVAIGAASVASSTSIAAAEGA